MLTINDRDDRLPALLHTVTYTDHGIEAQARIIRPWRLTLRGAEGILRRYVPTACAVRVDYATVYRG